MNFNQAGALATVQGGLNSRNGRYRISVYAGDRVLDLARCESTRSLWSGDIEITNGSANTNGGGAFTAQVLKTLAFGKQLSATATRVEVLSKGRISPIPAKSGRALQRRCFTMVLNLAVDSGDDCEMLIQEVAVVESVGGADDTCARRHVHGHQHQ